MGKYSDKIIEILEGHGDKGSTDLHEAFHVVVDKFLSPAEKFILIKEAIMTMAKRIEEAAVAFIEEGASRIGA